jgi:hypothetical protein
MQNQLHNLSALSSVRQIQYCYEPPKKWIFTPWLQPGEQRESKTKGL